MSSAITHFYEQVLEIDPWGKWAIGAYCVAVGFGLYGATKLGMKVAMNSARGYPEYNKRLDTYEADTVYVHVFPRICTKQTINLSPFAIKLESWLRLKRIPYKVVETLRFSSKTRQIPYVIHNGQEICNTANIIEYLANVYDVDVTDGLSHAQLGVARAFHRMLDESLSWTYFLPRYVYQPDQFSRIYRLPTKKRYMGRFIEKSVSTYVGKRANYQGVGRLPKETVAEMGKDDLRALSWQLGEKPFLMGEEITLVDCAAFGHLSQIVFVDFPYPHKELLSTECTNISPYMERIKRHLWPDWDDTVDNGYFES